MTKLESLKLCQQHQQWVVDTGEWRDSYFRFNNLKKIYNNNYACEYVMILKGRYNHNYPALYKFDCLLCPLYGDWIKETKPEKSSYFCFIVQNPFSCYYDADRQQDLDIYSCEMLSFIEERIEEVGNDNSN